MNHHQPDLFTPATIVPSDDLVRLRSHLSDHGWQTRAQLAEDLGWSERQIRETAEALGADIVRGQSGFKLTDQITREEIPLALSAAEAFLSQSKKMQSYGLALKQRLHALIA